MITDGRQEHHAKQYPSTTPELISVGGKTVIVEDTSAPAVEGLLVRKHPLAKCEECPLYEGSVFVPSDGPEQADLVLVGEAPGLNEAKQGKPFVGISGQLLDQILIHNDIEREHVFITNTCLCRPKDNSNPPAPAIRACRDRLVAEIEGRRPKVVVTLGNYATKAILGTDDGITRSRVGPPKQTRLSPDGAEVYVVPTFHPAAALYNTSSFPDIITDFGKVGLALKGEVRVIGNWTPPDLRIFDDPHGATLALRELLETERLQEIAVDIETGLDKDEDVGRPDKYRILCVGISHRPNAAFVLGEGALAGRNFGDLISRVLGSKRIIAQNGKFDLAGLSRYNPEGVLDALAFDTMLAHYCLDERRGTHSLDQLAIERLGSPDWKTEFRKFVPGKDFSQAPREPLYRYNGYDASNTYLLKDDLQRELEATPELVGLHAFLVRTSPTLMRMEMNGVNVDLDYNAEVGEEIQTNMEAHRSALREMVEDPSYNPNSWQQVQNALKIQFRKRVKNTRKETIALLQEKAAQKGDRVLYDFCEEHLAFKKDSKSYGTYIKGIRKRALLYDLNGRVFPDFLLHGTVTGRLSSRNPNLQNITRGDRLRRQFIPATPDHVFVQADYGQAELRVVCRVARDAYLREVLSDSDRDLHSEVAERFYGAGFTKEQRVLAKAVVFGLLYGREAYSLAMEHRMTTRQAQSYIDQFFEVIPDTVNWIEGIRDTVLGGDDLVTPFGRHRRFWLVTAKNRDDILKEARAFIPQSTASDITLEAANRLARQGFWDNLRIPVHDSLLMEVRREDATEVAHIMKQVMEDTAFELMEGYVPFPVDVVIGDNWGEL